MPGPSVRVECAGRTRYKGLYVEGVGVGGLDIERDFATVIRRPASAGDGEHAVEMHLEIEHLRNRAPPSTPSSLPAEAKGAREATHYACVGVLYPSRGRGDHKRGRVGVVRTALEITG
eukprot:scaffold190612_cov40-Tisochrysis_lutea.AAC.1